MDEGYIKYKSVWTQKAIVVDIGVFDMLNSYRSRLFGMKLIGKIGGGPGYGNVSMRAQGNRFIVSSTNTGHLERLGTRCWCLVVQTDIEKNTIWCQGLTEASSESLTHAAIYAALPRVNAVIHVHSSKLWDKYLNVLPTTKNEILYGTPEMAEAVSSIVLNGPPKGVVAMGGHKDGLISYGPTMDEAFYGIEQLFY